MNIKYAYINSFINSSQFNKKRTQLNICTDLLQWAEADKNYIKFIIMDKKTWVYRYYMNQSHAHPQD